MDLRPDPRETMLRQSARDLLARESPGRRIREVVGSPLGYDPALWRSMADLGWLGWVFPTAHGGGGGRFLDLVILEEELGRACVQSPFSASVVLAGLTILAAGTTAQLDVLLPAIAAGGAILTLAVTETGTRIEGDTVSCRASRIAEGWRLDGIKTFVPFANLASQIVLVTRTGGPDVGRDGVTLLLLDPATPGVTIRPTPTLGQDPQFEVRLDGVKVGYDTALGPVGEGRRALRKALDQATLCLAAEMLGGAQAVLDMALVQAATRQQRGGPIGRHQAIQHRCADVAISIETARVLVYAAAWRLDQGRPATTEVSMAKAWMSDCYRDATWLAALVLGGTGFMDDHDLGLHYRRAKMTEMLLGDGDAHRERVARAFLDRPLDPYHGG